VRRGLDRSDLEQIGTIGLIKAVDRFDKSASTPFEGFAWVLIVGELMHHVRDNERMLRAPRRIRDLERSWTSAERELWILLGREPSEGDVAGWLNAGDRERRDVQEYRASSSVASFDQRTAREPLAGAREMDRVVDRVTLESAMSRLTPLERRILRSIYVDGIPVVELAGRLGYSRRHLTRLHQRALKRLEILVCPNTLR
jgi:RNA polymerase sigma-B factor